jgi:anaerobic selenocysteine-containing dehydrogenase
MPAAIVTGWGLQRRRNGANIYRLVDALAAITRNIGIKGGGVTHGMDETRWFDRRVSLRDAGKERREIPRPRTGRGILEAAEPPLKVAVVSGGNPVNQCPDTGVVRRGFESIEYKVVLDMFMTDTAQLADLVLPTTHFLEETDVVASYWHNYVMPVSAVQERLGEEKTDLEIFALLAGKLGMGSKLPADPACFLDRLIAPLKAEGISLARIEEGPVRPRGAVDVPFADRRFKTTSGKFQFVDAISPTTRPEAAEYPYHLLSPHPNDVLHSQLDGEFHTARLPEARISPHLAGILKAASGERVIVQTASGSLICSAKIDEAVGPSMVVVCEGSWDGLGGSVNRLTSDQLSDQGECATYNDVMCRVSRVAREGV